MGIAVVLLETQGADVRQSAARVVCGISKVDELAIGFVG
jgi:hypothetical protein